MNAKRELQHPMGHPAPVASPQRSSSRWLMVVLAICSFCLPICGYSAPVPTVTASLEPAEMRPGAFTTYTITIENGAPEGAPKLKLPEGLDPTTSTPAFGQQTNILNGTMRQASTLT